MNTLGQLMGRIGHLNFLCVHSTFSALGLGKGQPRVLRILAQNGTMTQKEIAKNDMMSPATITVMLQKMEKNALIERRQDEADKRNIHVELTAKGAELERRTREAVDRMDERVYSCFSDSEKAQLRTLLEKLESHLEKMTERSS